MPKAKVITEELIVDARVEYPITPIGQTFGNDDLNLLKDKINEIIARQ